MPVAAFNFTLLVLVFALGRALAWNFFDINLEKSELLSVLGLGVTGGAVYQYLPRSSKDYFAKMSRSFLSAKRSRVGLSIAAVTLLLPALLLSHIDVLWTGSATLNLHMNGNALTLVGEPEANGVLKTRLYKPSFSVLMLQSGAWKFRKRLLPITSHSVQVPLLETNQPEFRAVAEQLSLTFFQYFEARFLNNARNMLEALGKTNTKDQALLKRLDAVYQILRLSFVESDLVNNKQLLLDQFQATFQNDPWLPLLRGATLYSRKDYLGAVDSLRSFSSNDGYPKNSTAAFFRGVCLLRASRDAKSSDQKQKLSREALIQFQTAFDQTANDPDVFYRSIARPSAIHFQGITHYYEKNLDEAAGVFLKASEFAEGGLKARTLNGFAYIQFIQGNLERAESALLSALESDATFPLARSNYGYVLLARGNVVKAREIFTKNASDERLKVESYRDIILARLALVHLLELKKIRTAEILAHYEPILADQKIQDYTGVVPETLRLAYVRKAVAKNIYLAKEYYGLEVFALALFTRSYLELKNDANSTKNDNRQISLLVEIMNDIRAAEGAVNPEWLRKHHTGFFSSISDYYSNKVRSKSDG